VRAAIAAKAGKSSDEVAYQIIGASWGRQITQQAALALVVFLVLVGLLIWIYFRDVKMSLAALGALLHDLIITIGIYALVGFTVTPATMIGVLTILGYSLYDTVVVFDKIRENVAAMEMDKRTYSEAANHAVNQVLVRSLNTTIIGVLPVARAAVCRRLRARFRPTRGPRPRLVRRHDRRSVLIGLHRVPAADPAA